MCTDTKRISSGNPKIFGLRVWCEPRRNILSAVAVGRCNHVNRTSVRTPKLLALYLTFVTNWGWARFGATFYSRKSERNWLPFPQGCCRSAVWKPWLPLQLSLLCDSLAGWVAICIYHVSPPSTRWSIHCRGCASEARNQLFIILQVALDKHISEADRDFIGSARTALDSMCTIIIT